MIENDLPDGWNWHYFNEICDFQGGTQPPKSEFIYESKPGYIRLLQIRDFADDKDATYVPQSSKLKTCNDDDVLIARYGASLGRILRGKSGAYNVAMVKTIPNEEYLDRDYLFYLLNGDIFQARLQDEGARAAQAGFNKSDLNDLALPLPPLDEQKRIAAIIDEQMQAIEDARAAAQAELEAAESLAAAYLREVFESDEAQEWEVKTLLDICDGKGQYGTSQKSSTNPVGVANLGMSNLRNGLISWANLKYIELPESDFQKYRLNTGDILFNRTNSAELVGKTAVFDGEQDAVFASYLIRFRTKDNEADPHFVSAYINSVGRQFIEQNMTRAIGQVNISASTMHNMTMPCPPIAIQTQIMDEIVSKQKIVSEATSAIQERLDAIESLPAAILRRAFNGEY